MPDSPDSRGSIVINTTPLITLAVATNGLDVLRILYDRVIVPMEVAQEVLAAGSVAVGAAEFNAAQWIERLQVPQMIPIFLHNSLDKGEASVIQAALHQGLDKVCIDEKVGRRIARLHGLTVTGSIGILAKARQRGFTLDAEETLTRLRAHGIWIGKDVEQFFRKEI